MEVKTEKSERLCKHVHISHTSKTDGTPYIKGYCPTCKAWVYTEKTFCICCMQRVSHKTHYLSLKRIFNKALKENEDELPQFKLQKFQNQYFAVEYSSQKYHFPLKHLIMYSEGGDYSKIMPVLQDGITRVRAYGKKK